MPNDKTTNGWNIVNGRVFGAEQRLAIIAAPHFQLGIGRVALETFHQDQINRAQMVQEFRQGWFRLAVQLMDQRPAPARWCAG